MFNQLITLILALIFALPAQAAMWDRDDWVSDEPCYEEFWTRDVGTFERCCAWYDYSGFNCAEFGGRTGACYEFVVPSNGGSSAWRSCCVSTESAYCPASWIFWTNVSILIVVGLIAIAAVVLLSMVFCCGIVICGMGTPAARRRKRAASKVVIPYEEDQRSDSATSDQEVNDLTMMEFSPDGDLPAQALYTPRSCDGSVSSDVKDRSYDDCVYQAHETV